MKDIGINQYYQEEHHNEFIISAKNLIYGTKIKDYIDHFGPLVTKKFSSQKSYPKLTHDLRVEISNVDEWNMFLIRLSIGLEMALKGLFLYSGYNIFRIKTGGYKPLKKEEFINLENHELETFGLEYFKQNIKCLEDGKFEKYREMIGFFQKLRNEYIHFAKNQYHYSNEELVKNFILLDELMSKFIIPMRDKSN